MAKKEQYTSNDIIDHFAYTARLSSRAVQKAGNYDKVDDLTKLFLSCAAGYPRNVAVVALASTFLSITCEIIEEDGIPIEIQAEPLPNKKVQ